MKRNLETGARTALREEAEKGLHFGIGPRAFATLEQERSGPVGENDFSTPTVVLEFVAKVSVAGT